LAALMALGATEAEKLFAEGRAAFKAEKVREACALFERSQQLEPALGTLLNLGICLETEGRLASAYVRLNEAVAWAGRTKEVAREEMVRAHLKAIRPRLSFITVKAERPLPSMVLSMAALDLPLSSGSQTLPVDPGSMALKVTAAGFIAWSSEVSAPAEGQTLQVSVPALAPEPSDAPMIATAATAAPLRAPEVVVRPADRVEPSPSKAPEVAGVVIGSAVLVTGAIGLAWSYSTNAALLAQQPGGANENAPTVSREQFETLKWVYPASWAAVGVGAATVAVSAYFLARSPSSPAVSFAPLPGGGAVVTTGTF